MTDSDAKLAEQERGHRRMTFGRHLRYVLVGPLIYVCVAVGAFVIDERNSAIDYIHELAASPLLAIFVLPFAYFFGALPAFFLGHADEVLFRRKVAFFYRLLLCDGLGILIFCGPQFLVYPYMTVQNRMELALPVLVAASVCCAWTNRAFDK